MNVYSGLKAPVSGALTWFPSICGNVLGSYVPTVDGAMNLWGGVFRVLGI